MGSSSLEQFIGVDAKPGIRVVYFGRCAPIEKVVVLYMDKFEKRWRIVCWVFRGCFCNAYVCDAVIATIFNCV